MGYLFASDQLTSQLQLMKDNKFDLITMFRRKPNYKMSIYGSVDEIGKMKMSDFLHLTWLLYSMTHNY